MDINALKNVFVNWSNLQNTDEVCTFFYDETNNPRKLYIRNDNSLNADIDIFALGGVMHKGTNKKINIAELRELLSIPKEYPEIKRKHVVHGNFEDIIKSPRTTLFLDWILKNDLYVHFALNDPFYRIIETIVDAIPFHDTENHSVGNILKTNLYCALCENLPDTLSLLKKHNYPWIADKEKKAFFDDLNVIVQKSTQLYPDRKKDLHTLCQTGRENPCDFCIPCFMSPKKNDLLVDNFAIFYFESMILHENAVYIFDEERMIQHRLNNITYFKENIAKRNHKFVHSNQEPGIQISDIFIGIMGKMCSYLQEAPSLEHIDTLALSADETVRKNLSLLHGLIVQSAAQKRGLVKYAISISDFLKFNRLFAVENQKYKVCSKQNTGAKNSQQQNRPHPGMER